jgi:hypothetical protein
MRMKKVNRYWCDFCNKAGLSSHSMIKHEKHCTMNLVRECRVCALMADGLDYDDFEAKKPLADLIAMLPDSTDYNRPIVNQDWGGYNDRQAALQSATIAILPTLRKHAANCPACIMAALRLAKIPVGMAEGFDFKSEMRSILDDWNEAQRENMNY